MPNYTKTYKLKKPLGTENYNVEDQNSNMDILDEELEKQGKQINDLKTPYIVMEEEIPPKNRIEGKLYFKVTDTQTVGQASNMLKVSPSMGLKLE